MSLFYVERAWATAMDLKALNQSKLEPDASTRWHYMKKLRKACKYAHLFEELVGESAGQQLCSTTSELEAKAYSSWIQACLHIENEDWTQASEQLTNAKVIYEKIAGVVDTIEAFVFQKKLEGINNQLRVCQHQISFATDAGGQSTEELIKISQNLDPQLRELLDSKINKAITEIQKQKLNSVKEINFHGKQLPIKNDRILLCLQKAEEVFFGLETAEDKLNVFTEALAEYDDAIKILQKEIQESGGNQVYQNIIEYINELKLQKSMQRYDYLIKNQEKQIFEDIGNILQNQKTSKSISKASECSKAYEQQIKCCEQLIQLAPSDQPFVDSLIQDKRLYEVSKQFYIMLTYLFANKLGESQVLLGRIEENVHKVLDMEPSTAQIQHLENLLSYIQKIEIWCRVRPHLQSGKMQEKQQGDLVEFPPKMKPISCKPIFYDMAWNFIQFPQFKDRYKKGLFSRAMGKIWGGGN